MKVCCGGIREGQGLCSVGKVGNSWTPLSPPPPSLQWTSACTPSAHPPTHPLTNFVSTFTKHLMIWRTFLMFKYIKISLTPLTYCFTQKHFSTCSSKFRNISQFHLHMTCTPHHTTLHHITLHYIILRYITSYYATLHHITLHYLYTLQLFHTQQVYLLFVSSCSSLCLTLVFSFSFCEGLI